MAVTLINGEHHRNPSGCHNKVKWILSQCKHDRKSVEDFFSRFRNGELLCINNEAQRESWDYAFWIANWWVHKKFGYLPPSVLDKYHWLLKEAYLKGLKAARPEWHDLKKNPDDLPESGVHVLSEKGDVVFYNGDRFCWFEYIPNADNIKLRNWEKPVAWCEKPEFKE